MSTGDRVSRLLLDGDFPRIERLDVEPTSQDARASNRHAPDPSIVDSHCYQLVRRYVSTSARRIPLLITRTRPSMTLGRPSYASYERGKHVAVSLEIDTYAPGLADLRADHPRTADDG